MAKKVVATLRKAKDQVKLILAVKTKAGAYSFKEEMVSKEQLQEVLKRKV